MFNKRSMVGPPPLPRTRKFMARLQAKGVAGYLIFVLIAGIPAFIWFGCRIEPGSGELAVLIRKAGAHLPSGEIVSLAPDQRGVKLDVLPEGRYFRNPYTWDWEIHEITDIPAGRLGVQTRLFGDELEPGAIIARDDTRGILAEVLTPGRYRINKYAYHVETFAAITIRPGHVGVVTRLIGDDVFSATNGAGHGNAFLVEAGVKGVTRAVLDPGTYYLNPYIFSVSEVNLQGQRFEMSGVDAISFLTMDGFTVTVEGTIEFALSREHAALLTHRVGDMDDIVQKVILPRTRGFSRIEGSKHPAIDFIVGETRQQFQDDLERHLQERCVAWGVDIRSVLVRKIIPPDEIASINRDREVAVQEARKFEQQIEQAISKAELTKQEMLAVQSREKVEADTLRIRAVINAEQDQAVRIVAAERERDVSQVNLQAAAFQAQAVLLAAEGERDAVRVRNEAEAGVLTDQVQAFDTGLNLARYVLYGRIGPRIDTILGSDQPNGLGAIFQPLLPAGEEVAP